jgi:hypothetical protein
VVSENITFRREGQKLVIEIDLLHKMGKPSKSGKTELVASTQGTAFLKECGNLRVNLNAWRPKFCHWLVDLDEGPYRAVLEEEFRKP